MAREPGVSARAPAGTLGFELKGKEHWQAEVEAILARTDGFKGERAQRMRFVSGRAVAKLKGKAPAKDVAAYVAAQLQEVSR